MNLFALLRIPGQVVGAVCDAIVSSGEARKARDLQDMYADMDTLNEVEAELDGLPRRPLLSWPHPPGDPDAAFQQLVAETEALGLYDEPPTHTFCQQCGGGYTGTHTCLRPQSSPAVSAAGVSPSEVSAAAPQPAPSEGRPGLTDLIAEVLVEHDGYTIDMELWSCICRTPLGPTPPRGPHLRHVAAAIAARLEAVAPQRASAPNPFARGGGMTFNTQ